MPKRALALFLTIVLGVVFYAHANESNIKLDLSGNVALEEGQYIEAYSISTNDKKMVPTWLNRSYAQIRLDAFLGEQLRIIIAPEVRLWSNTYDVSKVEQDI